MIGADVLHDAHVEPEDAPVARRREPRVVRLLARLVGARDELGPGLDPLHRPAEADREQRDEHVLRVDAFLRAEPAAGVGRDDAHALDRQPDARGDGAAQVIGRLVRRPDGQALRRGVVLGAEPARLDRHRRHAPVGRVILDDHRGLGERAIDVADDLADAPDDVARPGVHLGRPGAHRRLGVDHRGQRLVLDADELGRVGRHVRIGADDHRDRLADIARFAARQRVLGARCVQPTYGFVRSARAAGSGSATSGRSETVKTVTPGSFRAAAASTATMRARAWVDRTKASVDEPGQARCRRRTGRAR